MQSSIQVSRKEEKERGGAVEFEGNGNSRIEATSSDLNSYIFLRFITTSKLRRRGCWIDQVVRELGLVMSE